MMYPLSLSNFLNRYTVLLSNLEKKRNGQLTFRVSHVPESLLHELESLIVPAEGQVVVLLK